MKTIVLLFCASTLALFGANEKGDRIAQVTAPAAAPKVTVPVSKPLPARRIVYRPPQVGAPRITTGPATRGAEMGAISLSLLTPNHVALTTSAQPRLYWYHNDLPPGLIEISLVEPLRPEPLLQIVVTNARSAQVEQIVLEDHGVELKPHLDYKWSAAWVVNPQHRSKDLVAMGAIRRIPPLTDVATNTTAAGLAEAYATSGIWYDALSTLMRATQTSPRDAVGREDLDSLLRQVGLTNISVFEPPL